MKIGDKIIKKSGKPFKCGFKVVTVLNFVTNPHTNKDAVLIKEDNTIVDLYQVEEYKK